LFKFHDSHLHLTNYVQEGPSVSELLRVMGDTCGRATLFGIPLQQKWSFPISAHQAPTYYLQTDAPLYYYSFTDAFIAMSWLHLPPRLRARFDPMITGFNPADMYAADHVRRVLEVFPGVFSGIGEFTVHKEFVSSKLGSEVPSLIDPALDRLLQFAGEVGLLCIIHCDIDTPFPRRGARPAFLAPMKALLKRHPRTKIIWAHLGLGRVIRPVEGHIKVIEAILKDPAFSHVCFDISWDEVAKYLEMTPTTAHRSAEVITRYPDRFLFGTDEVSPTDPARYFRIFELYAPLWELLEPSVREKVWRGNYERLFDHARKRVRAWEHRHVGKPFHAPTPQQFVRPPVAYPEETPLHEPPAGLLH
jgi:hypothetical protein